MPASSTVSSNISGAYDLIKTGSGTLVLGGLNNTYVGQTNINAGIVQLTTVAAETTASTLGLPTGSVVVSAGATLQVSPAAATTFTSKQVVINGLGSGNGSGTRGHRHGLDSGHPALWHRCALRTLPHSPAFGPATSS